MNKMKDYEIHSNYIFTMTKTLENRLLQCSDETSISVNTLFTIALLQYLQIYEQDKDNKYFSDNYIPVGIDLY